MCIVIIVDDFVTRPIVAVSALFVLVNNVVCVNFFIVIVIIEVISLVFFIKSDNQKTQLTHSVSPSLLCLLYKKFCFNVKFKIRIKQ